MNNQEYYNRYSNAIGHLLTPEEIGTYFKYEPKPVVEVGGRVHVCTLLQLNVFVPMDAFDPRTSTWLCSSERAVVAKDSIVKRIKERTTFTNVQRVTAMAQYNGHLDEFQLFVCVSGFKSANS